MNKLSIVAVAACAACGAAIAANPFDQMRGKMKEGLYEYKMDIDMPGMPGGMGKHSQTIQHCVTPQDLEKGSFAKTPNEKDCEFQDVKFSGNTASYKMVCKGKNPMTADAKLTFRDNGFTSDMNMTMNQGGQQMTMKQHMDGKYLGACK